MLRTRVMPCLLLQDESLVKTVKFKKPDYIGDPVNAVRIYNELEVDELIFLDIRATAEDRRPPFQLISEIAGECFMPFTYGGGIRRLEDVKTLFNLGVEKVAVNSYALERPEFIRELAGLYGNQSIVVSMDVKKTLFGKYDVYVCGGQRSAKQDPIQYAKKMEAMGAGEILLTSIDRDGTMEGYDIELIRQVSSAVHVPVIACGGACTSRDFGKAVKEGGASAVAAGSMVVYQGKNRAVLINFPLRAELSQVLG
jgi:imidazole glycerol-phosphate synthase subunit HisF